MALKSWLAPFLTRCRCGLTALLLRYARHPNLPRGGESSGRARQADGPAVRCRLKYRGRECLIDAPAVSPDDSDSGSRRARTPHPRHNRARARNVCSLRLAERVWRAGETRRGAVREAAGGKSGCRRALKGARGDAFGPRLDRPRADGFARLAAVGGYQRTPVTGIPRQPPTPPPPPPT